MCVRDSLGMSISRLRCSAPLRVPAVVKGELTTRNMYVMVLTCNIFAMHIRTLTNEFRTSQETVSAEGMWYSGLPVFIRLQKPRSVTILKGRLFSETQWTISALQVAQKLGGTKSFKGMFLTLILLKYVDGVNRSPYLSRYVQTQL